MTRNHEAGAPGLFTPPISQKEMPNRTASDTILLLITSFVYTCAIVFSRHRKTHYLYLVRARLPGHGGRVGDGCRCAVETIPNLRDRLGLVAKHLYLQGWGFSIQRVWPMKTCQYRVLMREPVFSQQGSISK
jgi:hypothetical protein